MTTVNSVNTTLSGQTGTGSFVGSTSPTIVTPSMRQINDLLGNEILVLDNGGASPVNYVQIINNSTGAAPGIFAQGSDTNVNLQLVAKAAGYVEVASTKSSEQFLILTGATYLSATSFSFPTNTNSRVISVPDTTGTMLLTAGAQQMSSAASLLLDKGAGTESANAVTISKQSGVITTVALTTVQFAKETITLTNTEIATNSVVLVSIMGGSNTTPGVTVSATAGSGTSTIVLTNTNSAALNGTVIIGFAVF